MKMLTALASAMLLAAAVHAQAAQAGKPLRESDPEILTVSKAGEGGAAWIGGIDRGRGTYWLALCANRDPGAKAWGDCAFLGIEIEPDFIVSNPTTVVAYDKAAHMQRCDLADGASGWTCRPAERVQLPFYNCPAGVIC
jgi:hypothetical protein